MRRVQIVGLVFVSLSCLLAIGRRTLGQTTQPAANAPTTKASPATVIYFSSLDKDRNYDVHGTLYMPENSSTPCPALVVVHGTSGINSVGRFYRGPILNAGIAFFEVDFKTGIFTSPINRPPPDTFVPMGFAALKELRKLPAIDPNRIGIMGFSLGGHLTVTTAFEKNRKLWMGDEKGFATHVAFYPVCRTFITQSDCRMTGAPMIILYGTEDCYGEGKYVPEFKSLLSKKYNFDVTTVEYAGAAHDFNRNEPPMHYFDPAAIHGRGYVIWDENAANDSLIRVLDFLSKTLAAK
ncbi:MAG: dienelactone hydrolase family protein [Tepidisphaeraceae bacterium]